MSKGNSQFSTAAAIPQRAASPRNASRKARQPLLREQDRRGVFQIMQDEVHQHEVLSAVDIADAMGMSVSTLYNKLNPDVETHRLSLDEWRRFMAVTDRYESLRAIARRCGFLLLDLRSIEAGSSAVSCAAAQATREFAETLDAYANATGPKSEGGSGFTQDEAVRLEEEGLQTVAAIMELIEAAKREAGLPVLLHTRTDLPERATFTAFNYQTDNPAASYVEFDDFVLETGDSANGEDLWELLPVWLKTYPLAIGTDGDLALTPDGLTCFLQDVANVLDTEPGDLYAHVNYGAGLRRFLGEAGDEGLSRLTSQIRVALGDGAIRPRLDLANSSVVVTRAGDTVTINTTIAAIAGDTVVTSNLILNYGINGIENLWTSPPTATGTTTPVGPDGYLYPALGRDLFLDRGASYPNPSDRENLPQYFIVDGIGRELDGAEDWLRRMRLNFFPETADEDALVIHGGNVDVYRLADESLDDFRARVMDEWDQKKKDGTVAGMVEWFALYGFDATVTEGYSVVGPDDFPAAYWDELWVDATCVPGAVTIAPTEFFGRLYRRSRADRRVVFKSITDGTDPRRWGDGVWGEGWFWVESVFWAGA